MCIGVPVRVIKVSGSEATAELDGVNIKINIDLVSEVNKGDYVLLHSGCAIQRINEGEAKKTLELLEKINGGKSPGKVETDEVY